MISFSYKSLINFFVFTIFYRLCLYSFCVHHYYCYNTICIVYYKFHYHHYLYHHHPHHHHHHHHLHPHRYPLRHHPFNHHYHHSFLPPELPYYRDYVLSPSGLHPKPTHHRGNHVIMGLTNKTEAVLGSKILLRCSLVSFGVGFVFFFILFF